MRDEEQVPREPAIAEPRESRRGPVEADGRLRRTGNPGLEPDGGAVRPVALPEVSPSVADRLAAGDGVTSDDGATGGDGVSGGYAASAHDGGPDGDGVSVGSAPRVYGDGGISGNGTAVSGDAVPGDGAAAFADGASGTTASGEGASGSTASRNGASGDGAAAFADGASAGLAVGDTASRDGASGGEASREGSSGDGGSGDWGSVATRSEHPSPGGEPSPGATSGPPAGPGEEGAADGRGGLAAGGSGEPPEADSAEVPTAQPKRRSFWRELPVLIIVALGLALLIKTFAVQAFFIPSSSMENTLDIGDRVLVNKIVYHTRSIHRGDIVVFNGLDSWDPSVPQTPPSNAARRVIDWIGAAFGVSAGEKDYIKRVVGVPGDRVKCCDAKGRVTVNGVPLSEGSYLHPGDAPSATPFEATVPPGRLWVMGDNRHVSYDSRQHLGDPGGGSIPENKIIGRAFMIVWPVNRVRILPIPSTFEQKALSASGPVGQVARVAAGAAPAAPALLGFAGAVPLTLLQRRLRLRYGRRRNRKAGRGRRRDGAGR